MKTLTEKHYFIFKLIQFLIASLTLVATVIMVALPNLQFSIEDGMVVFAAIIGTHQVTNGVVSKPEVDKETKKTE